MKKSLKNILLVSLIMATFIGLTGCKKDSEKITATMT